MCQDGYDGKIKSGRTMLLTLQLEAASKSSWIERINVHD